MLRRCSSGMANVPQMFGAVVEGNDDPFMERNVHVLKPRGGKLPVFQYIQQAGERPVADAVWLMAVQCCIIAYMMQHNNRGKSAWEHKLV